MISHVLSSMEAVSHWS